jgi:hypothetical protein
MSDIPTPKSDDAEVEAPDIRAQMKAARRNITEAAARALAPEERRSFSRDRSGHRRNDG